MSKLSLEQELARCRKSAEEGYQLASQKFAEINKMLEKEESRITDANAEQLQVSRIQNTDLVARQSEELQQLRQSLSTISENIDKLHKRQQDFSIIVYGRTMAGKSTLMEILTHGSGKSIGNGSQRTTRDVRSYYWQGLKITDVPGICSFGGEEDDQLAMEAAKTADLILFLLTNDAPQADEAQCLAQLKSFGKPILGVINVKKGLNFSKRAMALRDLNKVLSNAEEIESIIEQFKAFDKQHNQDWSDIKFVPTHLLAAYHAHPDRDDDREIFEASRFTDVENFILEKVRADGRFIRIKTFVDSVAVPMNSIILKIFEHSANSLEESEIWFDKRQQLYEWGQHFVERSQSKIDQLYQELSDTLDNEIQSFAEYHYEDEKVNESWAQRLQQLKLDSYYQNLLQELANECQRKRMELSDELTQELSYSFHGDMKTSIELEGTTPWGQYVAMVLPNLLMFIPGIGWGARIAIGVGSALFSFLFDDKEAKIREAKAKLREDLMAPSHEILYKIHNQVTDIFNQQIIGKGINEFSDMLSTYAYMLTNLSKSQGEIADVLFKGYYDLNVRMLNEAIAYKGAGAVSEFAEVLRIPGETAIVFAKISTVNVKAVSELLGEKFLVMDSTATFEDILKRVLGCEFKPELYPLGFDTDEKKTEQAMAIIPQNKINDTNRKLAQQLASPYPIIVR